MHSDSNPETGNKLTQKIEIQIRPYQDSDYEGLRHILDKGNLTHTGRDVPDCLAEKGKQDPGSIMVAVTPESKVLGCIFTVSDGWAAFIFRLAVHPDCRSKPELFGGKSLGQQLMEAAETRLRGEGAIDVAILVSDEEASLQNWYKKQGYDPTGSYRFMWKDL